MPEMPSQRNERKRMSFLFPVEFYDLLTAISDKYNKDMTYIIMEAVNSMVMSKENIVVDSNGARRLTEEMQEVFIHAN